MTKFLIRAAALAAMTLPVAACFTTVAPTPAPPQAVMVAPSTATVVPPGSVVVKPY